MSPDLRDHIRLLLQREPSRSLPLGVLRERLHHATGGGPPGPLQLAQALGSDPHFRLLTPLPLLDSLPAGYGRALAAVGLPQQEPRVLLVKETPEDEGSELFGTTRDALMGLLEHDGMHSPVAEALAALEEIGDRLGPLADPLTDDAAAPSTTPLPGPRPARRSRRRWRQPASPPPRSGESR